MLLVSFLNKSSDTIIVISAMDGNQHIAEESIVKLQPLMAKKSSDIIPRVLPWAIFFWADSPFSAISDTFVSSLF